ncbi:hypothetical protein B296_00052419 [Ensete ventricosum]|uniref:Uncharacterized protein n=1 Tax=Ensete ventricosum TaxID=4639 RepID=A0A426YCI9_ENSVE|nr:hypothetical protein B296_00052419 [Ensete ventricosum]
MACCPPQVPTPFITLEMERVRRTAMSDDGLSKRGTSWKLDVNTQRTGADEQGKTPYYITLVGSFTILKLSR